MKSDLPANFLLYLRSGDLTISDGDGTAIEFSSKGDIRRINIKHLPKKFQEKMSLLKAIN